MTAHDTHCDQGENLGTCKYGDPDCPVMARRADILSHEHGEDLKLAALYLSLQPEEMANIVASHRKHNARRKAAICYGDSGSPVEPVLFIAPSCKSCMDPVVQANTSPEPGTCLWCYRSKHERPERKRIAWGDVAFWLTVGVAVIGLVAWVIA